MYNIDGTLKKCVLFRDGLLAIALGWLFDQRKIKWDFSVHNKYENDFVCETKNGKILFECKTHFIPKDKRSFEGQLQKDLNLLVTHAHACIVVMITTRMSKASKCMRIRFFVHKKQ